MSNRLLDLLPDYYQDIYEFRQLTESESAELETFDASMKRAEDDMFIMTSSEEAIVRRERMFKILADREKEDLDERRRRLVSRQSTRAPFTLRFLAQHLDVLSGPGTYKITMDAENYTLHIVTQIAVKGGIDELWYTLERSTPLNMVLITENELYQVGTSTTYLATTSAYAVVADLTHDFNATYDMTGESQHGTILTGYTTMELK